MFVRVLFSNLDPIEWMNGWWSEGMEGDLMRNNVMEDKVARMIPLNLSNTKWEDIPKIALSREDSQNSLSSFSTKLFTISSLLFMFIHFIDIESRSKEDFFFIYKILWYSFFFSCLGSFQILTKLIFSIVRRLMMVAAVCHWCSSIKINLHWLCQRNGLLFMFEGYKSEREMLFSQNEWAELIHRMMWIPTWNPRHPISLS